MVCTRTPNARSSLASSLASEKKVARLGEEVHQQIQVGRIGGLATGVGAEHRERLHSEFVSQFGRETAQPFENGRERLDHGGR